MAEGSVLSQMSYGSRPPPAAWWPPRAGETSATMRPLAAETSEIPATGPTWGHRPREQNNSNGWQGMCPLWGVSHSSARIWCLHPVLPLRC